MLRLLMPMSNEYMREYMARRRAERRRRLIELPGGQCARCGVIDDLQFDHVDGVDREFRLNGKDLDGPWERILAEAAKCQLLCPPCHRAKSKECGETGGGWNRIDGPDGFEHGTEPGYMRGGCRCWSCRKARYDARVRRGELSGSRNPYR
jgi:hypothetical protein